MKLNWSLFFKYAPSIALGIIVLWNVFKFFQPSAPELDKKLLQMRYDSISANNERLVSQIVVIKNKIKTNSKIIDSLENLKPKIKIIYLEKSKEIDNANVGVIVDEFTGIFTTNNIK